MSFAIKVRRIMLFKEFGGNRYLRRTVWQPTQRFLLSLAKTRPRQVFCFAGRKFNFPRQRGCSCQNIYLLDQTGKAAYLGTVFNKRAVQVEGERLSGLLSKTQRRALASNPQKIRRDSTYYVIPTSVQKIETKDLVSATKRYLRAYPSPIPSLATKVISFLDEEKGYELEDEILHQAESES